MRRAKKFFKYQIETHEGKEEHIDWFKLLLTVFLIPLLAIAFGAGTIATKANQVEMIAKTVHAHIQKSDERFKRIEDCMGNVEQVSTVGLTESVGKVNSVQARLDGVNQRLSNLEKQVATLIELQMQRNNSNQ